MVSIISEVVKIFRKDCLFTMPEKFGLQNPEFHI